MGQHGRARLSVHSRQTIAMRAGAFVSRLRPRDVLVDDGDETRQALRELLGARTRSPCTALDHSAVGGCVANSNRRCRVVPPTRHRARVGVVVEADAGASSSGSHRDLPVDVLSVPPGGCHVVEAKVREVVPSATSAQLHHAPLPVRVLEQAQRAAGATVEPLDPDASGDDDHVSLLVHDPVADHDTSGHHSDTSQLAGAARSPSGNKPDRLMMRAHHPICDNAAP